MIPATLPLGLPGRPDLRVRDLSRSDLSRTDLLPTYLQADHDVHGSHGLFYWLRARGRGQIVATDNAAIVLAWRGDVGRLAAFRPVGDRDAVVDLLEAVARAAGAIRPAVPLVARYCSPPVADRLEQRGWQALTTPWQPAAHADDETYPEVIVTAPAVELPTGQRYKPLRQAIALHYRRCDYHASPAPLGDGETTFITTTAARAAGYDDHEIGFNHALLASLHTGGHDGLTYHYLTRHGRLAGFAITANLTGIAHGYYLATANLPRLTGYFLWLIYLQQRRSGAHALNLGGSETASLHQFKTRTFPDHRLQTTHALQHPGSHRKDQPR
jgi:hypothetical protein